MTRREFFALFAVVALAPLSLPPDYGWCEWSGTFHDFRIYNKALTPAQIAASFKGGPDPAFLAE